MSKENSENAISSESVGFLEDVKKGKPRKFAMICKGTNIVSLVVYKKGAIESRKKEAKEAGRGQFYFGVVDGKGVDIRFVMARADGFEKPPVKTQIIKAYLADAAGMKCKPTFEIVDALTIAVDDEESEESSNDLAGDFKTRLTQLLPAIKAAAGTPTGETAKAKAAEAGQAAQKQDYQQANALLDEVESLLGGAPSNETATPPPGLTAEQLLAALNKLAPSIKQAVAEHAQRREEILRIVADVKGGIEANDLPRGKEGLLALGSLLSELKGESNQGSNETQGLSVVKLGKARLEWDAARKEARSEIERLKELLDGEYENDAEQKQALDKAKKWLDDTMAKLNEELTDNLDKVLNADPSGRVKLAKDARAVLERFETFVSSDPLMSEIDGNEFAPDMQVTKPLLGRLKEIGDALPA